MYLTQLATKDGNQIRLRCDSLPDHVFIPAVKLRDIYYIQVLTGDNRKGIEAGAADILIEAADSSNKGYINRKQLVEGFRNYLGEKIKLRNIHNNKRTLVTKPTEADKKDYMIFKLPDNCYGMLKESKVQPGDYIVAPKADSNFASKAFRVDAKTFRKMYIIPMHKVIEAHAHENGKHRIFTLIDKYLKRINKMKGARIDTSLIGISPNDIHVQAYKEQDNNTNQNKVQITKIDKTKTYRYVAVKRLLKPNGKTIVGYIIKDRNTNKMMPCKIPTVMHMCSKGLVENIELVQPANGAAYLRGNGISLESIPGQLV